MLFIRIRKFCAFYFDALELSLFIQATSIWPMAMNAFTCFYADQQFVHGSVCVTFNSI